MQPVQSYPRDLLRSLAACSPERTHSKPTVAVFTPGIYNSAYFEHAYLDQQMGCELVEGRDLVVRDGVVYMRTTEGERRVDVIYRRVGDEFLDPVVFRRDSLLGAPAFVGFAAGGGMLWLQYEIAVPLAPARPPPFCSRWFHCRCVHLSSRCGRFDYRDTHLMELAE